jgi:hypothetical protein
VNVRLILPAIRQDRQGPFGFALPVFLKAGYLNPLLTVRAGGNENTCHVGVTHGKCVCPRVIHYLPGGCLEMSESDVIANQKQILRNQKEILSNQNQIKSNQDTIKKNQGTILKNQGTLDTIVKNQKQILAAIKK